MTLRYMTKKEAAEYLRVSPGTIDNLRKNGLSCAKYGSRVVFDRDVLDAFVKDQADGNKEQPCGTK